MHPNGVWKGFMGSSSDDLQTSPSPDSPHQYLNILVSLCALTVKKLWAVCKPCCFLLLALVCFIHCQVFTIMSLSTLQLVGAKLTKFLICLFKESTHLTYNESQEISGVFRVKLEAVHGIVENSELTGSVPCSASVLMPLPRSRGTQVRAASIKLLPFHWCLSLDSTEMYKLALYCISLPASEVLLYFFFFLIVM